MKKRKKRSVTLIEIMIVILLIGLIGGALAFNMRGSMDQGKVFKTRQNIERIKDILMMAAAEQEKTLQEVVAEKDDILKASPLCQDAKKILKDGWGKPIKVEVNPENEEELLVSSQKLDDWDHAQNQKK